MDEEECDSDLEEEDASQSLNKQRTAPQKFEDVKRIVLKLADTFKPFSTS